MVYTSSAESMRVYHCFAVVAVAMPFLFRLAHDLPAPLGAVQALARPLARESLRGLYPPGTRPRASSPHVRHTLSTGPDTGQSASQYWPHRLASVRHYSHEQQPHLWALPVQSWQWTLVGFFGFAFGFIVQQSSKLLKPLPKHPEWKRWRMQVCVVHHMGCKVEGGVSVSPVFLGSSSGD